MLKRPLSVLSPYLGPVELPSAPFRLHAKGLKHLGAAARDAGEVVASCALEVGLKVSENDVVGAVAGAQEMSPCHPLLRPTSTVPASIPPH